LERLHHKRHGHGLQKSQSYDWPSGIGYWNACHMRHGRGLQKSQSYDWPFGIGYWNAYVTCVMGMAYKNLNPMTGHLELAIGMLMSRVMDVAYKNLAVSCHDT